MSRARSNTRKEVVDYRHDQAKRTNNPPAGLAWQDTDETPLRRFKFDPHMTPELWWAGKSDHDEFDVEAPSIHVHERLSTEAILHAARKEPAELTLFADPQLDRSKAVEFYQHEMGWANRMILGDSLRVMASLLERERLGGQVQVIYIDPPFGINFNSNFQRRISNRSPKETSDETLTREPEQVQAYRDTWELGIHSYLTYLRDRIMVAHELLAESGSIFVQIGPDNAHRVRALLDEVFGDQNHVATITAVKTSAQAATLLPEINDTIVWFAKDKSAIKYRQAYAERDASFEASYNYQYVELPDGTRRAMTKEEKQGVPIPSGARRYRHDNLTSQGFSTNTTVDYEFEGKSYHPGMNKHWKTTPDGLDRLVTLGRIVGSGNTLSYLRYMDDFPVQVLTNVWTDTVRSGFGDKKRYVVETASKIVARCILMASDPGDLVIDPTCGSGTTAYVCENLGRRWITIDTSRVALSIARERLLTSTFPYYKLQDSSRGVDAGFEYKTVKRIMLSTLAKSLQPEQVALYDQPITDGSKVRVSGPFTFEALSRYSLNPREVEAPQGEPSHNGDEPASSPNGVSATTQALNDPVDVADHVTTLLAALESHGIPRPGAKPLSIRSVQRIVASSALHAEGFYVDDDGAEHRFGVSIGPRFGPLTVAQIDDALRDAHGYELVVFVGFAVHAEAQDYTAKGKIGHYQVAMLEANADLLLGDLLKKTTSSQTFRSFSSPDVKVRKNEDGKFIVEVVGMDTFDTSTGEVVSRDRTEIAAWFLDHDYDRTVFHVNQASFTRSDAWSALSKALKGTVDEDALDGFTGYESIPFDAGPSGKAAVRVIDDHGTTSEAVVDLIGSAS